MKKMVVLFMTLILALVVGLVPVAAQGDKFEDTACWTLEQYIEIFDYLANPTYWDTGEHANQPVLVFDFYNLDIHAPKPPFAGFDNRYNEIATDGDTFWRYYLVEVKQTDEGCLEMPRAEFDILMFLNGPVALAGTGVFSTEANEPIEGSQQCLDRGAIGLAFSANKSLLDYGDWEQAPVLSIDFSGLEIQSFDPPLPRFKNVFNTPGNYNFFNIPLTVKGDVYCMSVADFAAARLLDGLQIGVLHFGLKLKPEIWGNGA